MFSVVCNAVCCIWFILQSVMQCPTASVLDCFSHWAQNPPNLWVLSCELEVTTVKGNTRSGSGVSSPWVLVGWILTVSYQLVAFHFDQIKYGASLRNRKCLFTSHLWESHHHGSKQECKFPRNTNSWTSNTTFCTVLLAFVIMTGLKQMMCFKWCFQRNKGNWSWRVQRKGAVWLEWNPFCKCFFHCSVKQQSWNIGYAY